MFIYNYYFHICIRCTDLFSLLKPVFYDVVWHFCSLYFSLSFFSSAIVTTSLHILLGTRFSKESWSKISVKFITCYRIQTRGKKEQTRLLHICSRYTTPAKCSRNKFSVHERSDCEHCEMFSVLLRSDIKSAHISVCAVGLIVYTLRNVWGHFNVHSPCW